MIRKLPAGTYVVLSESGKRLSKAYTSRAEAEARLRQIEAFKHMDPKKRKK